MGFIPNNNNQVTLNAYYTQLGRSLFVNGNETDKIITSFALGDGDIDYGIAGNSNYLTLVPDLSGDVDSCINSIADGVSVINPLYCVKSEIADSFVNVTGDTGNVQQLSTLNDYEFRIDLKNQLTDIDGKNFVKATVDLGGYVAYLNKYGTFTANTTSDFYKINTNLSHKLSIIDTFSIYDKNNKQIFPDLTVNNSRFEFSGVEYSNFVKFNRFTLNNSSFNLTPPHLNYQTSPLHFTLSETQDISLTINNRTLGYGVWSVTNGVYDLISFTDLSTLITDNFQLNVDTTNQNTIVRPTVELSYYENNIYNTEYYILRDDYNSKLNNTFYPSNQYIKSFVDYNSKKSLITREVELLKNFITNRDDLFELINGVYYSNPITIRVVSTNKDLKIKESVVKIILKYNPLTTYSPNFTDNYVTLS